MSTLWDQAVNPQQYSREDLRWHDEGRGELPIRQFFHDCLFGSADLDVMAKDTLDIGAGMGWLVEACWRRGAKLAAGLEPAACNVAFAKDHYPQCVIIEGTLDALSNVPRFNVITAVMSFNHLPDIPAAMCKCHALLRPGSGLWLIVPNFHYAQMPRFDYQLTIERLNSDEYIVATTRPYGTVVDVVRKPHVYWHAAEAAGLALELQLSLRPTLALAEAKPQYREFLNQPIADAMRFRRRK